MRNPMLAVRERFRQWRARRKYMPRPARLSTSTTAKLAVVALLLLIAAAALLELRRGGGAEAALAAYVASAGGEPVGAIVAAAQSRRLLLVSDVAGSVSAKRFAADLIEEVVRTTGLDVVALDVDVAEQPHIDAYLSGAQENAAMLLARPRAVHEATGVERAYLEIYRRVWALNSQLGADRRIRIVALAPPDWPPAGIVSPAEAARRFGQRDAHMLETILDRSLAREPGARVLFFVDGLNALGAGGARIMTGGAAPVEVTWLAALLRQRYPQDVFSVLVDAQAVRRTTPAVAAYMGTDAAAVMRRDVRRTVGVRIGPPFDEFALTPVQYHTRPAIEIVLEPRSVRFSQLADAYVYLGN